MAGKPSALGKGLDALLGGGPSEPDPNEVIQLRITEIEPDRNQPRTVFDDSSLEELASSIKQHGVIQPLIVRRGEEQRYIIVAGERRWRAARMAGLETVPAMVRTENTERSVLISMIENLQREDLNCIDEAMGFRRLMTEFGYTQEKVAEAVGKSRPAVANALRLLAFPDEVQQLLKSGKLSPGQARPLLKLGEDDMIALAHVIVRDGLSARECEKAVKRLQNRKPENDEKAADMTSLFIEDLQRRLCASTGHRIKINHGSGGRGKIEIEYSDTDDLNSISELLMDMFD